MALNVGELVAFLKLDDKQFKGGMDKARSSLEGLGSKIGGLLATGAMAAVAALAAASVAAAKLGVDYNAMLETSNAKWTTLLGSQAAAQEQLKWMADFAASTPFEFEELDNAASRLKAFGFTIEQTRSLLGTLGDAAAATGKGTVALDALSNALGKIQGTGKVTTEALNMMSDQGINGFKILAEGVGVSEAKVRDLIEKGVLPAGKAIPILAQGLDKAFGGAMQKQAETFTGRLSTLKDNAKQLLGNVFQPLFEYLSKNAMPKAIKLVDDLAKGFKQGGLKGALGVIFPQSMIAYFESLFGLLGDIGKWFGESLPNAGSIGKDIIDGIFIGLKAFVDYLRGHKELVVQILAAIGIGFAVLFPIPAAIGAVIAAGALLIKNWDAVKRAALNAWSSIKAAIYTYIADVIDDYARFISFFSDAKGAEARAAADSLRAQAKAEHDFIDDRNEMAGAAAQAAADAEEAKALSAWKSSTQQQRAAQQAGKVETDVWASTTQAAADATDAKAEKQKEFLDEFEAGFKRSSDAVVTDFERAQDDATTAMERAQEDRLTLFERAQDQEKTAFERALDDRKTQFERAADDERTTYERHQGELLDAFKARQDAELSALQDRQDAERAAIDADFAAQIGGLKGEKDAIRAEQDAEERAKRRASLTDRIAKAEEDLAKAELTRDPEKIAKAEEDVTDARGALAEWLTNEQRKQETDRIDNAIEALRQEQAQRQALLKQQQDAEKAQAQAKQVEALAAYQRQLADEKTAWLRAQDDRKTRFEQEQADIATAFEEKQKTLLEGFKRQQEDEKTEWERVQKDRLDRYKTELSDLHDSFEDKLTAQAAFVRDWNRNAASMAAMAPGADGGNASTTAPSGGGGGGTKYMAKGGILNGPTFVAGEAGREVVSPLDTLWSRIARMAEQVSQRTAAAVTGGADMAQQVAQQVATMMGGMQMAGAGEVTVILNHTTKLNGRVLAEETIKEMVPILRPIVRSM